MNLDFELADPEHPAHDEIQRYLTGIEKLSRKVCVMCGEECGVRLSARFMPHEWKMPLCKAKNRLHGDKQLYRLIEPDFDLSNIRDDLIRRKKLRREVNISKIIENRAK